jgi:Coenzyme PQQ synthesis protein D (PqqD)
VSVGEGPAAPIARADVTLQEVGREAILHDQRDAMAHVVNGAAARVWRLLDGRAFDEVVIAFAAQYDRSPDEVRPDVARVIDGFRDLGLLRDPRGT